MSDVLSVRFDTGTKARLERVRLAFVKQTGVKITRAAVIRMLLEAGFTVIEKSVGGSGRGGGISWSPSDY